MTLTPDQALRVKSQLVQFTSVQYLDRLGRRVGGWVVGEGGGGHEGRFSRDPLPVFSAGGACE